MEYGSKAESSKITHCLVRRWKRRVQKSNRNQSITSFVPFWGNIGKKAQFRDVIHIRRIRELTQGTVRYKELSEKELNIPNGFKNHVITIDFLPGTREKLTTDIISPVSHFGTDAEASIVAVVFSTAGFRAWCGRNLALHRFASDRQTASKLSRIWVSFIFSIVKH